MIYACRCGEARKNRMPKKSQSLRGSTARWCKHPGCSVHSWCLVSQAWCRPSQEKAGRRRTEQKRIQGTHSPVQPLQIAAVQRAAAATCRYGIRPEKPTHKNPGDILLSSGQLLFQPVPFCHGIIPLCRSNRCTRDTAATGLLMQQYEFSRQEGKACQFFPTLQKAE